MSRQKSELDGRNLHNAGSPGHAVGCWPQQSTYRCSQLVTCSRPRAGTSNPYQGLGERRIIHWNTMCADRTGKKIDSKVDEGNELRTVVRIKYSLADGNMVSLVGRPGQHITVHSVRSAIGRLHAKLSQHPDSRPTSIRLVCRRNQVTTSTRQACIYSLACALTFWRTD